MGKKTVFTNITPLPPNVSREVAIAMLHDHAEMIELNPLVIEHHLVKTPRDAPKDEFLDCAWHEMTDRISYLPGGIVKGKVTYKGCFHDLPHGLQTHVYAPMSLDIREKWTVCGTLPGEPDEARELGLNTPRRGLYLREDGEMKCNMLMSSFVRKNLDNAHKVLVERILAKAERIQAQINYNRMSPSGNSSIRGGVNNIPPFQPGSHMGNSHLVRQMSGTPTASPTGSFRPEQSRTSSESSTPYTSRPQISSRSPTTIQELPVSQPGNIDGAIQPRSLADNDPEELQTVHPALREQYRQNLALASRNGSTPLNNNANQGQNSKSSVNGPEKRKLPTSSKTFAFELEGSRPETSHSTKTSSSTSYKQGAEPIELDGGYTGPLPSNNSSPLTNKVGYTHDYPRDGSVSELSAPLYADRLPQLTHMRSFSTPMIEANTYIDSVSSAHNMEPTSDAIGGQSAVGGGGAVVVTPSRFRGLSTSAGSRTSTGSNNVNDNTSRAATLPLPTSTPNNNPILTTNKAAPSKHSYPPTSYHNHLPRNDPTNPIPLDRYSVVSDMTDMPTPKADRFSFGPDNANDRFSVISDFTDGVPTPKIGMGTSGFERVDGDRDVDWEMQRRGFI